jgi:hypothetical protein
MSPLFRTTYALAAAAALALSGCSGSSGSTTPAGPVERIIFSDGSKLHLATFDGSHLVTVATAQVPAAGLLAKHEIFGIMKHPTKPWLYVTSFQQYDWGNARIDRFDVSQSSITWIAREYDYTVPTLDSCSTTASGTVGLLGTCAPVDGAFAPSGNRLYVQNDSHDTLEIFRVDPDGALSMLYSGQSPTLHGVALDPSGATTFVYNGSIVFGVANDVGTTVNSGGLGGNSTVYIPMPGDDRLLSTDDTNRIAMYSLANPADPAVIGSVTVGANQARAVAIDAALNRVVVVGQNSVKTYGYSGVFTPEASFDPHVGTTKIENRDVALFANDTRAAVSFFVADAAAPSEYTGGVAVYGIDPSGAITTLGTLTLPASSRVVKVLKL